jgi:hypothetical protein
VKRVNLIEYFNLAEALTTAKRATDLAQAKTGNIWIGVGSLPFFLRAFVSSDNGFATCKHVANELIQEVEKWVRSYVSDENEPDNLDTKKFDVEAFNWQYSGIGRKLAAFRSVFEAECRDVDVYSVGQISIYKTSELVSAGAGVIPIEMHGQIPQEALGEFNSAGKCLAFDLPTACGFHALRGLELMMDAYLKSFGVTSVMHSWNDYIKAAKKLIDDEKADKKPSPKVAAMLDRMRELERNPLMHPRDTLDLVQADMLFRLCAITVVEIARDIKINEGKPSEPANNGRKALQRDAKADARNAA